MILTCPSCGTQYVVKDGAIPPEGRQVRCASCKHSWHQHPDEAEAITAQPIDAAADEPKAEVDEEESLAEATLIEPRSGPEAEERAFEEATLDNEQPAALDDDAAAPVQIDETGYSDVRPGIEAAEAAPASAESDWQEPPHAEAQTDEFTPYAASDEVAPKGRSPLLSILIVVVLVIAIAAAFWFLAPPDLKARLGLAEISASPLALVTTHMDRQRLESGNELLTVAGRVINPTGKEQSVPPLQAQLKTRTGKVVYRWTIPAPASSLAPGASAPFNSAEVNVPPGGDELTITLGAQAG